MTTPQNTFNQPRKWKATDPPSAKHLNQVVNAVDRLINRANPPQQLHKNKSASATFGWVIVRATDDPDPLVVLAERVEGIPGAYNIQSGGAQKFFVMPGMNQHDYDYAISNTQRTLEDIKMLPIIKVDGIWYIWQLFKEKVRTPNALDVLSDAN